MATNDENSSSWMSDVQRAIALLLIGAFTIITILATVRLVFAGDVPTLNDMSKTLQAALVNMSLIALGFFFGSNMSKLQAEAGQQKIMEKLTGTPSPPGPPGPIAPVAIVPWWSLLTEEEKSAIGASNDLRVKAFAETSKVGKATAEDLAYLVSVGLLTQDRATVLLAA